MAATNQDSSSNSAAAIPGTKFIVDHRSLSSTKQRQKVMNLEIPCHFNSGFHQNMGTFHICVIRHQQGKDKKQSVGSAHTNIHGRNRNIAKRVWQHSGRFLPIIKTSTNKLCPFLPCV